MNDIENRLAEEKKRMDSITAPAELEMRLRGALDATTSKRAKRLTPIWALTAVSLFFILIVGYHYNAFAFYGKKFLGFDEVINGTLKELNEKGLGQMVEKKTELEDGTELIIEGIMTDANQLVMYYTLTNPNGIEERSGDLLFSPSRITGFLTNSNVVSGTSIMNEEQTEIKGMMSFKPVSPFSKKLTLHFRQQFQNTLKEESISFPYNPNMAMQTEIKQSINKTLKVDKGTITFNSITATPTMTVIDGSLYVENFDRVNFALGGIELIANGTPIELMGGGSHSSLRGRKFDIHYDPLPERLDSLELVIKEFVGYQMLKEKISLTSIDDKPITLDGKELWVKDVSATVHGVEITIATEDDVMLDGVSIETKNEITPLKTTVNKIQTKQADGRVLKERTLLFETITEPEYLLIEGMHYMKAYNNSIEIPVE